MDAKKQPITTVGKATLNLQGIGVPTPGREEQNIKTPSLTVVGMRIHQGVRETPFDAAVRVYTYLVCVMGGSDNTRTAPLKH
jgi:hypothetical protein